jgi:hypothetical protein
MAYSHLYFNDQTNHGRLLRSCLQQMQGSHDGLVNLLSIMTTMIDGDGSSATQFGEVVTRFGFPDTATAKAAWDELNSLQSKFSGDGSVSFVNAAMKQAFSKFG